MPRVSVIVLTANRRALLAACLEALAAGTRRPDEVVVVNNRSTDDTADFLASAQFPFELRPVEGPEGSFSECRNAGLDASSGDLIAFLDDDCLADGPWLERLLAALEHNSWDAVGGLVLPAEPLETPDWYGPELAWTLGLSTPVYLGPLGGRLELPTTSNLAFRRTLLPEFRFRTLSDDKTSLTWNYEYSREDSEFWRGLRRAGRPVGLERRAIVWHQVPQERVDRARIFERARQDGRGAWNRDHCREDIRPAARDVVFSPLGALEDYISRPVSWGRASTNRAVWAARQRALLEAAIDDRDHGVAPTLRSRAYLAETVRAAASAAKTLGRLAIAPAGRSIRRTEDLPEPSMQPDRLLVVCHPFLGDSVLALPAIRQLADAYAESMIDVVVGDGAAPLLAANVPENVEVLTVPPDARGRTLDAQWRLRRWLAQEPVDAVLIMYTHNLPPAPLFLLGQAPVVGWREDNGFEGRLWGDLLDVAVPKTFRQSEVAALLGLLGPLGVETQLERPHVLPTQAAVDRCARILERAQTEPGRYVVLHVEGTDAPRDWPLERFATVARHLHERGYRVFFEGSPAGRRRTEFLRAENPWIESLHGVLNTDELAAVLAGARLYVGIDSGPAHVAQAVGVPAVLLFGRSDPRRWGPLPPLPGETPPPAEVVAAAPGDWIEEEARGLPPNAPMLLLEPERVLGAVERILAASEKPSVHPETN